MALTRRQLLIVLLLRRRLKAKEVEVRKKKECWVRRLYTERTEKGEYHQLVREMKIFDKEYFFQHFRMGPEKFEEILSYVAPKITQCSVRREPIGPSERLCVTLRYLLTGDAQTTIAASYRMSRSSVSRIIKETSDALWSGDEAFPLKDYLVKPYSRDSLQIKEKIANYRISRARRQVENVFGTCASRFRIFRRPIIANVETVISVTKAVVAIHNYLTAGRRFGENQEYYWDQHSDERVATDAIEVEGGLLPLMRAGSNNYSKSAKEIRDDFRDYFCSEEGSVSWQWETVLRTRDPFDEH